jgi:hypothetical protein
MADFELTDDFMRIYDVSSAVATVADADRETAWRALLDVDLKRGRTLGGARGRVRDCEPDECAIPSRSAISVFFSPWSAASTLITAATGFASPNPAAHNELLTHNTSFVRR